MTGVGSRRANLVTLIFIGLNIAVYLVELAAGGTIQGTSNWLFSHGALVVNGVYANDNVFAVPKGISAGLGYVGLAHGEWYRMLTSAFLHYGPFHLAINMYSLFFAGTLLEHLLGRWRFALIYIASGLAGAAGAAIVSPDAVTVGASGAIFGILGALFVLERRGNIATGGQIAGLIVINLIFTFALSSNISVGGHVGGLIGGFVLTLAVIQFRRSPALAVASAVAVAGLAFLLAYLKVKNYS